MLSGSIQLKLLIDVPRRGLRGFRPINLNEAFRSLPKKKKKPRPRNKGGMNFLFEESLQREVPAERETRTLESFFERN